jgi:hypothetical protein
MTLRLVRILVPLLLFSIAETISGASKPSLPANGVVPNERTAVRIAEAAFEPVFGTEEVARYIPYHAQLKEEVWTIYGTLKPGSRGGTPMMTIRKQDAKVLEIWFSQ